MIKRRYEEAAYVLDFLLSQMVTYILVMLRLFVLILD